MDSLMQVAKGLLELERLSVEQMVKRITMENFPRVLAKVEHKAVSA